VPVLRYVGVRYGDVENTQQVADYVVVDLDLTYKRRLFGVTDVTANLAAMNLFNRQHIGVINTSDFALSNGVTYYTAAPITVMGSLALGL
jgi:iron complex outermembrane receptor protein